MPNIKACFATTKYCRFFLKNEPCLLKTCSFFHSPCACEDMIEMEKYNSTQIQDLQKDIAINYIKANRQILFATAISINGQGRYLPNVNDCTVLQEILEDQSPFAEVQVDKNKPSPMNRGGNYRARARTTPNPSMFSRNTVCPQSVLSCKQELAWSSIPGDGQFEHICPIPLNKYMPLSPNWANEVNIMESLMKYHVKQPLMFDVPMDYLVQNQPSNIDPIFEADHLTASEVSTCYETETINSYSESFNNITDFNGSVYGINSPPKSKKTYSTLDKKSKVSSEAFEGYKQKFISNQ